MRRWRSPDRNSAVKGRACKVDFVAGPSSGYRSRLILLSVWIIVSIFGLSAQELVVAAPQAQVVAKPGGDGPCPQPALLQQAIVPKINTDQYKLNNIIMQSGMTSNQPSGYSFKTVLIHGRHLFTTPFTEPDGAGEGKRFANGEGPLGPREAAFTSNLKVVQGKLGLQDSDFPKLLDIFVPPYAHLDSQKNVRFAILRLNGLDSQSCFECHNSIGSAHVEGEGPLGRSSASRERPADPPVRPQTPTSTTPCPIRW